MGRKARDEGGLGAERWAETRRGRFACRCGGGRGESCRGGDEAEGKREGEGEVGYLEYEDGK